MARVLVSARQQRIHGSFLCQPTIKQLPSAPISCGRPEADLKASMSKSGSMPNGSCSKPAMPQRQQKPHRKSRREQALSRHPRSRAAAKDHVAVWTVFVTVLLTLCGVLLVLNFRKPEKEPHHQVDHLFGIDDEQMRREMGTLLGPAIVPGNEIRPLM